MPEDALPWAGPVFYVEEFVVQGGLVASREHPGMAMAYVTVHVRGSGNPERPENQEAGPLPMALSLSPDDARDLAARLARAADLVETDPTGRTQDRPPESLGPEWRP